MSQCFAKRGEEVRKKYSNAAFLPMNNDDFPEERGRKGERRKVIASLVISRFDALPDGSPRHLQSALLRKVRCTVKITYLVFG